MKREIYTLIGKALLDNIKVNFSKEEIPALNFSDEIVLSLKDHEDSALYYQLEQLLIKENANFSKNQLARVCFFVDFNSAFPLKNKKWFDMLFNDGFRLDFGDGQVLRYLPFLSSQSQSKKLIYAFIREDLFKPLRQRLDLDFDFEKDIEKKSLSFLPKLYAYRALYLSSSVEAFRYSSLVGPNFFNSENIIVLPEREYNQTETVKVFTAETKEQTANGEAVLNQKDSYATVNINCFDGEGIISPKASELINEHLKEDLQGNSFQIRMPFLKGVLHTVDFHKFLQDKGIEKEAYVLDVFNKKRDLFKANIIIRPSMFKLYSLVKDKLDNIDLMEYYFEKMAKYNHGLYVVKTNSSFHNTNYVRLSSQQLSTFDLSSDDIDAIIKEHIDRADAFCPQNLEDPKIAKELSVVAENPEWMRLIIKEPRLVKDTHIQKTIKSHRVSKYNDIALGKITVLGENRFLSGDLYVFLIDLLERYKKLNKDFDLESLKLKKHCLYNNGVYLPGGFKDGRKVALVRSPHLSRNEDVGTTLFSKKEYEEYFKHLTGVVMIGDHSYINCALGGADFDGDHISIIYDKRIINACFKSGYVEARGVTSPLPFIHIKELNGQAPIIRYNYVSSQAVYNTFSNRIGNISNAAMKIAAVEYDKNLNINKATPKAALCTILTGNEIDATKKGIRPHIDTVINFSRKLDASSKEVVEEIDKYIKLKREIEGKKGEIPSVKQNGEFIILTTKDRSVAKLSENRERNAVAGLLYRWADAFLHFKSNTAQKLSQAAFNTLNTIFDDSPKNAEKCEQILTAFKRVCDAYTKVQKNRQEIEQTIKENEAKITVRIQGQYDDVYAYSENAASYKDKLLTLQEEIFSITKNISTKDIEELLTLMFSEAEDYNPHRFWPYAKGEGLKTNPIYNQIMQLENSELLLNFEYEGYRLIYYLLQNLVLTKTISELKPENIEGDDYTKKYAKLCFNEYGKISAMTISKFEQKLRKIVLCDLLEAENLDANNEENISRLIARLYPLKDEKLLEAFWKIFTESQVLLVLGGKDNA